MLPKNNITIIFSTENGMVALDSPVKLKIVEFIHGKPRSFEDVVNECCKAKSTISVHLKDLVMQNIILEQKDPSDKRKKHYSLNSQFIAYSQTPIQNCYNRIIDRLMDTVDSGNSEMEFFRTLCHTIRYGLEAYGMNPKPVFKNIGNDIGQKMSRFFVAGSIEELLTEMAVFWQLHSLGEIEIHNLDPLTLIVHDCFDCSDMPNVGRTLCALVEGIIEGIFEASLKLSVTVKELECFGTGHNHCKFEIRIPD
ncbi:MAG TPA: ArsR family transcriptional regulator [Methanosarcinales archaeon]|nr:ArsR family transcriptional regulator [Methanosarcinales archaeon]